MNKFEDWDPNGVADDVVNRSRLASADDRDDRANGDGSRRPTALHDGGGSSTTGPRRRRPSSSSASRASRQSQDDALSRHSANLSVAELSRMEETMMSQSSHHEEEEERQKKKLERRAKRNSGIKAKRTTHPPTEIQIKRRKAYIRFKHLKKTDLRDERDVGGSMECLTRTKLGERAERRRLESVARAREGADKMMGDAEERNDALTRGTNLGFKSSEDHDGVDWNFFDEGYTTMPMGDAAKLPFYIYGNSKRRSSAVPEIDVMSKAGSDANHYAVMFSKQSNVASGVCGEKKRGRPRDTFTKVLSHLTPTAQPCDEGVPLSFPLHFNQSKKRMDLHGMIDTVTPGSERMVLTHGRNATRLWIRMVASGVMARDFDDHRALKTDVDRTNVKFEDDSVSNVSSSFSSKSSVHSYQPLGVFSQMSYGNTSVIAMENVDDKSTTSVDEMKKTPLFRLMSMVHSLPKFTHRHRFLIKVAHELGMNRRLWEDELRCLVERTDGSDEECGIEKPIDKQILYLTHRERLAIKSFLGVDGSVTSPPGWTSDPSMPTHPTVLKQRVHCLRSLLLNNLRRLKQERKKFASTLPTEDFDLLREHTEAKIEEGEEDMQHIPPTTTSKSGLADDGQREPTRVASSDEAANCVGVKKEPPSEELGEDGKPTAFIDESRVLMVSVIDEIQRHDRGAVDKYAKIIHQSQIEISHINAALASFMDHLTSSMARLRQEQQLDSSDFQHRRALKLLKEEVGFWHESIESYLNLAISLTEVREFMSPNVVPESAAQAKAIMASQSYLANGGGVGYGRKRWKSKLSSWEVKEENNSSDDSDASEQNNDDMDTTVPSRNTLVYLEKKELHCIKLAATEIAKRGKDRDWKSTSFTPIHITTGIAMLVENLTPRAAELLSRQPCPDSSANRTPFDLMSNMLALVEDEGSLISFPQSAWEARGNIVDITLVKAMLEAAMMFRSCIVKEPENVDHWSWYVATLLGVLCMAFGRTGDDHPLESFPRVRNYAAIAVNDLVIFAQSHDCTMFHLAVSSMLEWKRPIFLLHRPRNGFGLEVNYLHAYHVSILSGSLTILLEISHQHEFKHPSSCRQTYCWATKVCTRASIEKVILLCESNYLPRDGLIDVLASAIERDPCEREHWARLVKALGAVEEENAALHSEEGHKWWGALRVTHWEDQFFYAPFTAKAAKQTIVDIVSSFVESHVAKAERLALDPPDQALLIPAPEECLGWIWNPLEDGTDVTHNYDILIDGGLLPQKTCASSFDSQRNSLFDSVIHERLARNPSCEALCMKIVVASHLLGVRHRFVCDSIWWLAVKLWQSSQAKEVLPLADRNQHPYAEGLTWLSMYGIDASSYFQLSCSV